MLRFLPFYLKQNLLAITFSAKIHQCIREYIYLSWPSIYHTKLCSWDTYLVVRSVKSSVFLWFNTFSIFLLSCFSNILSTIDNAVWNQNTSNLSELPVNSLSTVSNSSFWEYLTLAKVLLSWHFLVVLFVMRKD